MKKFATCLVFLFCLTVKSQVISYQPKINVILDSKDKKLSNEFFESMVFVTLASGYKLPNNEVDADFSIRAMLIKRKDELILVSTLLMRNVADCRPNAVEYIATYTASGESAENLAIKMFVFFDTTYWLPEKKRREKLLNP